MKRRDIKKQSDMENRLSQSKLILQHLKKFGSIEPLTALREYGCYRLGSRICDLRKSGHTIRTEYEQKRSKITGNTVRFARYFLV